MEQVRRRPGRPPAERRRIQMAMRITPELRDELVARAAAKGRSITQEMEKLLEQGLLLEKLGGKLWRVGSDVMGEFQRAARNTIKWGAGTDEPDPLDEPTIYAVGMMRAIEGMAAHCPEPHPADGPRKQFVLSVIDAARGMVDESLGGKE